MKIISRDLVFLLFLLDPFEYGKCLETGETIKSFEYGNYDFCTEYGKWKVSRNRGGGGGSMTKSFVIQKLSHRGHRMALNTARGSLNTECVKKQENDNILCDAKSFHTWGTK